MHERYELLTVICFMYVHDICSEDSEERTIIVHICMGEKMCEEIEISVEATFKRQLFTIFCYYVDDVNNVNE